MRIKKTKQNNEHIGSLKWRRVKCLSHPPNHENEMDLHNYQIFKKCIMYVSILISLMFL